MKNLAIKAENISKQYRLGEVGTGTLSHDLNRFWHKVCGKDDPYLKIGESNDRTQKGNSEYVWSLRDINFQIEQGDAVGIIGRNGAGKSTLLKLLSKVTQPTTGSFKVNGRIASLLEVGTGFNPEMTGRENIYLNGAILGMRRAEITRKLDEIIAFSGVERYIDTPVKRYSSGMYVRLAFAVAAHLEAEILIVDEVLAVGDADFQKKCLGKMNDVSKGEGRTVLFVSHNMGAISQLCINALFLNNGICVKQGDVNSIISLYLRSSNSDKNELVFENKDKLKGQFLKVNLFDENRERLTDFPLGKSPYIEIEYILRDNVKNFHVALILMDSIGNHIYSTADTDLNPERLESRNANIYKVRLKVPVLSLNVGSYLISLGMGIVPSEIFHRVDAFNFNIVDVGDFGTGKEGGRRKGLLVVENEWHYI